MAGVGLSQKSYSLKRLCWGAGWLLLLCLGPLSKGQPANFSFSSFTSTQELLLAGSANLQSNRLQIAKGTDARAGTVWYRHKLFVQNGFESRFQVRIGGPLPSQGFAWVLHGETLPGLGSGTELGYGGLRNSVAVEFDLAPSTNYLDAPTPHISVQTRGVYANTTIPAASLGITTSGVSQIADGNAHEVRVQYALGNLQVSVDNQPALAVEIDLGSILRLEQGRAWVGFTAGSSAEEQPVEILSWSFTATPGVVVVGLTNPAPNMTFAAPAVIALAASATSSNGIARVEFYAADELLGQSRSAPFQLGWSNAVPGQHTVRAVAFDTVGNWSVSAPVNISVTPVAPPIGINFALGFGGTNYSLAPSESAGLVRQSNWNNTLPAANGTGSVTNVRSGSGAPSALSVTYQFSGAADDSTVNSALSGDHLLMRAYLADYAKPAGQTNSTVTINDIPYGVYDLIVYSDGNNNGQDRVAEFRVGGRSIFLRDAAWTVFAGRFVEARSACHLGLSTPSGNFVRFRGLTNRNVNLVITERSTTDVIRRAAVNAIQIVPSILDTNIARPRVVRGPYLQSGGSRSISVCWRTDLPATTELAYGLAPGALNLGVTNTALTIDHEVQLSGLTPNTRYYYAVRPALPNVSSNELTFVTNPETRRPFRIWAIGDVGTADFAAASVRDAGLNYMQDRKPDLFLLLGDNAYTSGSDQEYQGAVFDMFAPLLRQVVTWSCMGNHETYALDMPYLDIFHFPTDGRAGGVPSGSELYYSFNYANVHFVCLEGTTVDRSSDGVMANWLRADLAANTSEWLIAYFHQPPYSKGSHDSDAEFEIEMFELRANLVPILEAYGVDLVLSGNSHNYERSYLMDGHYGVSSSFVPSMIKQGGSGRPEDTGAYVKPTRGPAPHQGTVYVVAGNGGVLRPPFGLNHPVMYRSLVELGSLIIDIDGPTLDCRMIRENGSIGDHFTIRKGVTTNALPRLNLHAVDAAIDESASAGTAIVVSREEAANEDLQIFYNVSGSAKNGSDYARLNGSVQIPAGDTEIAVPVVPLDDADHENAEEISISLTTNTAPFSLVLLPDTSAYTAQIAGGLSTMLAAQSQWVLDHVDDLALRFVLHAGNVTENNLNLEWKRAQTSMSEWDGVVPYAVALGEQDGMGSTNSQTGLFNLYFPAAKFRLMAGFGGVFESNKAENIYYYFTGGGIDWLLLVLEFGPREALLSWANRVIALHPQRKVIVLTHAQLSGDDLWHGSAPGHTGTPAQFGRRNNGVDLWAKLLRRHENIALVLSGHAPEDGSGRRIDFGDYGNRVLQISSDFSRQLNGGNGYLRLFEFVPNEDKLTVRTYSPYLKAEKTDPENRFEVFDLGIFKPWHLRYELQDPVSTTIALQDNDSDAIPPAVTKVFSIGEANRIVITFSEAVDRATVENVSNYELASGIAIQSARLLTDGRTVELITAVPLPNGTNRLNVTGVQDLASPPNTISGSSNSSFVHRLAWMFDDFSEGSLGGWMIIDEGTVGGPSIWTVPMGKLDQSSEIFGPTSGITSGRKGTLAIWSDPDALAWQNYILNATLHTRDSDGMGVVFRYSDTNNYYKLEMDQRAGFTKLFVISNGVERTLAEEPVGFELNTDCVVRVELSDTGIQAMVDGQTRFGGTVSDRTLRAGTIGLYCWRNAGATFDDIEVSPPGGFTMLGEPELRAGQFEFKVFSEAGGRFEIQTSPDFRVWDSYTVVTNSPGEFRVLVPAATNQGQRFYRARALP